MLALASFKLAQLSALGVEHLRVRRPHDGLADALRGYGEHYQRRAGAVRWELGDMHSVVVPCYGHAPFLAQAIDSITRQDWRPLEIVAVNDASPDATQVLLERLSRQMPEGVEMRVVRRRRNHGQAAAVNLGVLNAKGSVITIVNDDDYLLEGAVRLARELIAQHRVYLFGPGCEQFHGEVPTNRRIPLRASELPAIRYNPSDVFDDPTAVNMSHSGSAFLRTAWQAVNGYRPMKRARITIASDREFQLRIASMLPILNAPEVVFAYWRQGTSVDSERFT
jgi:glycosyltransferase involved in cell wall biosynthesis